MWDRLKGVAEENNCTAAIGRAITKLDLLLKKHGMHRLIVVGLITHTCAPNYASVVTTEEIVEAMRA